MHAALDLSGSDVIEELVALTGVPDKVVSIADLTAPDRGVRFAGTPGDMPAALAETVRLIGNGELHIPNEKIYALADAAAAHRDSKSGHTRGRRVITV